MGSSVSSHYGALGPSSQSMPVSSRLPISQSTSQGQLRSQPLADVPAEQVTIIEQTLSKFIGPMAKMLVRKELGRRGTFKELIAAVADTIDHPEQRELFLQALKRALPRRPQ
jgi:hypothetical protein